MADIEWPINLQPDRNGFLLMTIANSILEKSTLRNGALKSLLKGRVSGFSLMTSKRHDFIENIASDCINYVFPKIGVTKEEFVSRLINMDFVPPLGGPYLALSAAAIEDETPAATLFDILAGEKEKLTKHRMGLQIKSLANGEEGLTWAHFSTAMGAK